MLPPQGRNKPKKVLKRFSGRYLYVSLVLKSKATDPKIYFQISKKMVPKAADRNLIKRRIRSLLGMFKGVLESNQALLIGLRVKTPPNPTLKALKEDLNQLIK